MALDIATGIIIVGFSVIGVKMYKIIKHMAD
jgi:hypothetical protein